MDKQPSNNNLLYKYMGFAFQVLAGLGLGAFVGYELDKWIKPSVPIFVWLLPLLVIIGIIINVVKDTSGK
jgi:F0F1-type ATP synthase assembly protein I